MKTSLFGWLCLTAPTHENESLPDPMP